MRGKRKFPVRGRPNRRTKKAVVAPTPVFGVIDDGVANLSLGLIPVAGMLEKIQIYVEGGDDGDDCGIIFTVDGGPSKHSVRFPLEMGENDIGGEIPVIGGNRLHLQVQHPEGKVVKVWFGALFVMARSVCSEYVKRQGDGQ